MDLKQIKSFLQKLNTPDLENEADLTTLNVVEPYFIFQTQLR